MQCIETNQWLCSAAARAYGGKDHQSPPVWAGPSGYISGHFAIGSQINSPSATTIFPSLTIGTEDTRRRSALLWIEAAFSSRCSACSSSCSSDQRRCQPHPLRPSGESKKANLSRRVCFQHHCCKCCTASVARAGNAAQSRKVVSTLPVWVTPHRDSLSSLRRNAHSKYESCSCSLADILKEDRFALQFLLSQQSSANETTASRS